MAKIYEIDEKTRIRRMDALNWTVEALKNVKKKDGTTSEEWVGAKGQGYGPYFGNLGAAARWIAENKASKTKIADLKGFISAYERIRSEIVSKITAQIEQKR